MTPVVGVTRAQRRASERTWAKKAGLSQRDFVAEKKREALAQVQTRAGCICGFCGVEYTRHPVGLCSAPMFNYARAMG
jgi:hypothetical protein